MSTCPDTAEDEKPRQGFVKWTMRFDRNKYTLSDFIGYFEVHADLQAYSENVKCQQLLCSFGTDAIRIAKRLGQSYGYDTLCDVLHEYYEPKESRQAKMLRLRAIQRKPSESARDFANQISDLVCQCYDIEAQDADNMTLINFIQGHEESVRCFLVSQKFTSVDEAVNFVDMLEDTGIVKKINGGSHEASHAHKHSYAATSVSYTHLTLPTICSV